MGDTKHWQSCGVGVFVDASSFCRRAKSLATSRKLQEIVRAQQKEIMSMKRELQTLNLRSFPAFANLYTRVPDADTNEIKDKISAVHGYQ